MSAFNFKVHCLFCGDPCIMEPDKKNPSRWQPAYLVRTVDPLNPFKNVILNICAERNDIKGEEVRLRVNGCATDLHCAEARYHDDCRKEFMGRLNIQSAFNARNRGAEEDVPFQTLCKAMLDSPEKTWSSIELYSWYKAEGGKTVSRRELMIKIKEYYGEKVLVLTSPGIANIIMFTAHASSFLNVVKDDDEDIDLENLAKVVRKEINALPKQRAVYKKRIKLQTAINDVSPTIMDMLKAISPKFDSSLSGALIGNIITSIVSNQTTTLQVALGLLANKKSFIGHPFDYGVTCSPDELRRFKVSAAVDCAKKKVSTQISTKRGCMIQTIIDNYDTPIASQNGLQQTHSLATVLTQPETLDEAELELEQSVMESEVEHETITGDEDDTKSNTFPRLKKSDLKDVELPDIQLQHYDGPKKPLMPEHTSKYTVLSLKFLAHQAVILNVSKEKDFQFLTNICTDQQPEFSGFNTRVLRESGSSVQPKNKTIYRPLLGKNPSDPSTVLTAMLDSKRVVKEAGQDENVITADIQIYRIMVDLAWHCGEKLDDFVLRLGGMHMLMSFVGCVGVLMGNSGLEELMKAAFAGVPKMLSGKNFPMNVRALRMVVEEVLSCNIDTFTSYDEMMKELERKSAQSRTAKKALGE